jgi:hypothetical protein
MSKTNWRTMIGANMAEHGESPDDIVSCTLTDTELDETFDNGFGGSEGKPFTLWTKKRVYFPVVYDGAEWVASVSRRPNGKATPHVGGE